MRTGRLLRSLLRLLPRYRRVRLPRRGRRTVSLPFLQVLEPRLVRSASSLTPPVVMLSATTTNSMSVTIDYQMNQTAGSSLPLQFGVYRSSDSQFDSGDSLVGTWTASGQGQGTVPSDASGLPATAPGTHQLTIPLPGGLPPDPQKPYVLVVADPSLSSATTNPQQTASFRTYVIGVVTHGALVNPSWKHGPPWALQTATILKQQGYDAVIPFNWASQSSNPGHAAMQGPRLARQILATASQFPTSAPVDLQLIGHSEGAVVNTQAIVALEKSITPQLKAGFLEDTLLDPHAANNNVPSQASAASGLIGALARVLVTSYQARANDPPVFIPAGVDAAQVFYQHSPASSHQGIYNLWGQVPVPNLSGNTVAYYNLTAAGVIHAGNYGVSQWYRNFVAPTLGDQAPLIQMLQLRGQIDRAVVIPLASAGALAQRRARAWGQVDAVQGPQTTFSGTAAPGSKVRVYLGPAANPSEIALAGQTTADTTGAWALTTRPLPDGCYRAVAMAFSRALQTRPGLAIVPMVSLGRFTHEGEDPSHALAPSDGGR